MASGGPAPGGHQGRDCGAAVGEEGEHPYNADALRVRSLADGDGWGRRRPRLRFEPRRVTLRRDLRHSGPTPFGESDRP